MLRRLVSRHPLAVSFAVFAVVMAVSLRSVMLAAQVSGGSLPVFPASARDLFTGFTSSLEPDGLGSSLPASPSLVIFGLSAVLALGKGLLAEKLLLLLALPMAAATCTRALRVVVPNVMARLIAGVLYATSPLATAALSQGRSGELFLLVLLPPILAQVWLALEPEQPRERWRPALRFALLTAVAVALNPPALVVIGVTVLIAAGVAMVVSPAHDWAAVARRTLLLAGGLAGALVLLLPWSLVLFTSASPLRASGNPLVSPTFVDLIQLRPGGPGQPAVIGPLYPFLAVAGVVFAAGARRLTAFWLGLGLLVAALLAAWQASGTGPVVTDWPGGVLLPGAVAWAAIAAIGFAAVLPALSRSRNRLERVAATFMAVLTALGAVLVLGNLARGDWEVGPADQALPATVTGSASRVLWLASRPGGGVWWAVSGPHGPTLLDEARPASPGAEQAVEQVVTDILESRTHRAGTLLRVFNIGFVVVREGPEATRLNNLLARQGDLQSQVSDEAGLYSGPGAAPGGLAVDGATPNNPAQLLLAPNAPVALDGAIPRAAGDVTGPATVLLPIAADRGWRATVGGTELRQITAFGWAQGFQVAGGVGGRVEVAYTGQRTRTFALLGELVLVLLAMAMLARPTRRPPPPAPVSDEVTGELRLPAVAMGRAR